MLRFIEIKICWSVVGRQFWFDLFFALPPTKSYDAAKNEHVKLRLTRLILLHYKHFTRREANWLLLLLLCDQQQQSNIREERTFFFCVWDPSGQPKQRCQLFYDQLLNISKETQFKVYQDLRLRIQAPHSNTCGLYCLYITHYLIQKN